MQTKNQQSGRWGQDRRLEFIDFRLRWEGRLNRSDLTDFFGISVPQASLDIAAYLELAKDNVAYDRSVRAYFATDSFVPVFSRNSSTRYLNELLAVESGVLPQDASFVGWQPTVGAVPVPLRAIETNILILALRAIREQKGLKILYQSLSRPEPGVRVVNPHALGTDGFRWHLRAYCHTRNDFLDFVIGRILEAEGSDMAGPEASTDTKWNTTVQLVLMANPDLNEAHRKVVELDYGMEKGMVNLECRQALLFYTLKQLGLEDDRHTKPEAQQIILKNRDEVLQYL